jgi:hypothetical protein
MAARVLVVHWNEAEARERVERLERAGFQAAPFLVSGGVEQSRALHASPPDAVVIDLTRRPSQGRDFGIHFRSRKSLRNVALVFIAGDAGRTAQVRTLLPDAVFTTWPRIRTAVERALRNKPENPVVPGTFAGYSGTPLPKKLRIAEGSTVALLDAPPDFEQKLQPLPAGVQFRKKQAGASVILLFVKRAETLARQLAAVAPEMREGRTLWLIWPKKTSGVASDLTQQAVRDMGLARGLVDYKVCAVDETWTGLAFAVRRAK